MVDVHAVPGFGIDTFFADASTPQIISANKYTVLLVLMVKVRVCCILVNLFVYDRLILSNTNARL